MIIVLIGSCSPVPASAAETGSVINAALIDAKTRFTDTFNQTYNNLINLPPDWLWFFSGGRPNTGSGSSSTGGVHTGGGRHRGSALADVLSADVSNASSPDSVSVSPVYTMYGKSRFEYSNGNYEIFYTSITISSNKNPVTGGNYSGIPNYTYADFGRTDTNLPNVGTWFIVRCAYDSDGNSLYTHCFAFSFDSMPYVIIYNNGTYGFNPSTTTGKYYSYDGNITAMSMNNNTVNFKVSANNSIVSRTDLNWDSRYSDDKFIKTDYSLNSIWFASCACSNNDDFLDTVDSRLTNNYNYGLNFKPVITKYGIDARTIINNSNVSNYNGFDTVNNNIVYNYDTYENYFVQHDEPQILSDVNNIYGSQPVPDELFTSPVRYNYPELFSVPLTNDYLPDSWLSDYPPIVTNPNIDIIVTTIPHFTLPAGAVSCGAELVSVGYDFYDSVPALLGILLFFGVAGILVNKFLL